MRINCGSGLDWVRIVGRQKTAIGRYLALKCAREDKNNNKANPQTSRYYYLIQEEQTEHEAKSK